MLRDVVEDDLDAIFEQHRDPESVEMAKVPSRDREGFDAHWQRVLAGPTNVAKVIDVDGVVAGTALSWEQDGRRLVGYWLAREYWGRGLATQALAQLVAELPQRPLHAWVVTTNAGSIRVLQKCGFVEVGRHAEHDEHSGETVEELLYELR